MDSLEELNNRITRLENENEELRKWQGMVNRLLDQMLEMIKRLTETDNDRKDIDAEIKNLWIYANINRYRINSLPYELMDPDYRSFYYKPKILTVEETRRLIIEKKMSIARFGDGEFAAIIGQKRWNFQAESKVLSEMLQEVLSTDRDGIMVGLNPSFYMNLFNMSEDDADGVRAYMQPMVRRLHAELLDPEKQYGNALFHNIHNDNDVIELKKIWNDKECVFIEGIHTCMGVGNDLFNNCRSIERVLGPAENAIEKYDEILKEVLKQPKNKLILLALGPTATVLAYNLYREGYQAVDIGHIDLIYEAYIRKLPNLYGVDIPYKYCSKDERISGRDIETVNDPEYRSQIVALID